MSNKTTPLFKLRPFTENDSEGFLLLRNLLYPDHIMSLESFCHHEKTRDEKIQHKHWVWGVNDGIFCSCLYTQWEETYHPQKFVIKIYVHPDHWGKGYGTLSYDFIIKKLELLDPIKISTNVYEPHTHSIHFFKNKGFKNTFKERESSLDLIIYNPKLYQDKFDSVFQKGFRIVTLSELRKEESNADYKAWEIERDAAPDMPFTDPIIIPEFDVYKKTVIAHPKFNPDSWFFVLNKNKIAGLSHLWKNDIDGGIDTGLTAVRREYRRMRVATALKHTSLTWAKKNDYKWIRTDNAEVNKGMLSINIQAGFKFMSAWLLFEKYMKDEK